MATVTTPRLPLRNRTRKHLRKVFTRGTEYDFMSLLTLDTVRDDEDFLGGVTFATSTHWTAGGAGTGAAYVANEPGGAINLTVDAVDNHAVTLYMDNANVQASRNPVLAVRLKLTAVTASNVQIGFTDTKDNAVLMTSGVGPFVSPLAATPTLTSPASDSVAAVMDTSTALDTTPTSAAHNFWSLAYAKAGTTGLVIPSGSVPAAQRITTAATYQWVVLALVQESEATADVDAYLYVNGNLLVQKVAAVTTAATALYPFVLVGSAGGAAQVATVDFVGLWMDRDLSV